MLSGEENKYIGNSGWWMLRTDQAILVQVFDFCNVSLSGK
jgi:hypothetical protein